MVFLHGLPVPVLSVLACFLSSVAAAPPHLNVLPEHGLAVRTAALQNSSFTPTSTLSGSVATITGRPPPTNIPLSCYPPELQTTVPRWWGPDIANNTCTSAMDDGCPIWTPCNISIGTIKLLYWSTAAPNESYTLPTTLYDPTYDFTFTYPSIYMVYHEMSGYNSCGGNTRAAVGPTLSTAIQDWNLTDVSTMQPSTYPMDTGSMTVPRQLNPADLYNCTGTSTTYTPSDSWGDPGDYATGHRCNPYISLTTRMRWLGEPYWRQCGFDNRALRAWDPPSVLSPWTGAIGPASAEAGTTASSIVLASTTSAVLVATPVVQDPSPVVASSSSSRQAIAVASPVSSNTEIIALQQTSSSASSALAGVTPPASLTTATTFAVSSAVVSSPSPKDPVPTPSLSSTIQVVDSSQPITYLGVTLANSGGVATISSLGAVASYGSQGVVIQYPSGSVSTIAVQAPATSASVSSTMLGSGSAGGNSIVGVANSRAGASSSSTLIPGANPGAVIASIIGVMNGGSTTLLPVSNVVVVGSSTFTENSQSQLVIGTKTMSNGVVATINSQVISQTSRTAVVVNGNTRSSNAGGGPTTILPVSNKVVIGSSTFTENSQGQLVIGTQTLSSGVAATVNGQLVSQSSSGAAVVVNGNSNVASASTTSLVVSATVVIGKSTFTENSKSQLVIGSKTLSDGVAVTVDGEVISQSSGALIVMVPGTAIAGASTSSGGSKTAVVTGSTGTLNFDGPPTSSGVAAVNKSGVTEKRIGLWWILIGVVSGLVMIY